MNALARKKFETLIEENKARLLRVCSIYANGEEDSKDLFQEVVFQIWKAHSTFKGEASWNTWVYRVALNVCMRYGNRNKKTQTVSLDSVVFESVSKENDELRDAKVEALRSCLRELPDSDRSIAVLVLDEMSYREISEITGLTENHIAVKMKRIKKKLLLCINLKLRQNERFN